MSSDESDDLPTPLPIEGVRTPYPHIWSDDSTTYSGDVESTAEMRSKKKQSVEYASRGHLKRVSRNTNEVSVSPTAEVCSHKLIEISDPTHCAEKAVKYLCKKSRSPVAANQVPFRTYQPHSKTAYALPTIGRHNLLSYEELPESRMCPDKSSPASCDESDRKLSQKRPQSKNEHKRIGTIKKSPQVVRIDQNSIGMETDEPAVQYTTNVISSNVARDVTSNLSDKSNFMSCSPQQSSEKSLKRASPVSNEKRFCPLEAVLSGCAQRDNIIKTSQSHNKGTELDKTNEKSPDKKLILSPRSARLARACFGEKPKRTKFSKLIFSSDTDFDVSNPDKMTQSPSRDLLACERTMCSPKVDSDISGTANPNTLSSKSPKSNQQSKVHLDTYGTATPTTLSSKSNQQAKVDLDIFETTPTSKSPKGHPKSGPGSSTTSCSIGMLFLDEDPSMVRPPPKKKSPSKRTGRSPTKVELLTDDGLWSNMR